MKRFLSAFLSVSLLLALSSCGTANAGVNVTVSKVKSGSDPDTSSYNAYLQAATEVTLVPKVTATIQDVRFSVGDHVNKGDLILSLDQSDLLNQLRQAQAAYGVAQVNYESAKGGSASSTRLKLQQAVDAASIGLESASVAYQSAQSNYDRLSYLVSIGEESSFNLQQAEHSLSTAKYALDNAQNALKSAQDTYRLSDGTLIPESISVSAKQLESAKASLATAESSLRNTQITAPISGVIADIQATKGEMASPQSTKVTLIDPSSMDLVISVTGSDVLSLQPGLQIPVTMTDLPSPYTGTILTIAPAADTSTGLFPVKIRLDNASGNLRAGMLARAQLSASSDSAKRYIPQQSVLEENGAYFVYKVSGQSVEKVPVTIGEPKNLYLEITSALTEEDSVVVEGADQLTENSPIHIIKNME